MPACDACSDLSMSSFLLFGITILPALRMMSPLSAMLRSLQILLNGAVVLFLGGALSVAYSSSLFMSDCNVVVAALWGCAYCELFFNCLECGGSAEGLGYLVLFAMCPFNVESVFCQLLSYSQYSHVVHLVHFVLE